MTRASLQTALCQVMPIGDADGVPEWVHLLPAGEIRTVDGRGPYKVTSLQAVIDASLRPGDKLPLDENHSTDKAAPLGLASPARGWIVELEARSDGLWGRVEWTGEGQRLMADKAYRGISPAILHSGDKTVVAIPRASLTNTPNLAGLVALHAETMTMDWKAKLIEMLGLDSSADDAAITAALKAKMDGGQGTALCAADVLTHPTFVDLQSQLTATTAKLAAMEAAGRAEAATRFVDAAIAAGRVGVKPARDEYISLHTADPAKAEALIGKLPIVKGEMQIAGDPAGAATAVGFNADDRLVMSLFGVDEDEYKAGLTKAGLIKEIL